MQANRSQTFFPKQKCVFEFHSEAFLSTCLKLLVALLKMQFVSFPRNSLRKRVASSNPYKIAV